MNIYILTGLLASLLGGVAVYLASPNQRLRATPWPARPARMAGALLLLAGLAALLQSLRPAAGAFVFVHWLMLVFIALPYLGAWRAARAGARP